MDSLPFSKGDVCAADRGILLGPADRIPSANPSPVGSPFPRKGPTAESIVHFRDRVFRNPSTDSPQIVSRLPREDGGLQRTFAFPRKEANQAAVPPYVPLWEDVSLPKTATLIPIHSSGRVPTPVPTA